MNKLVPDKKIYAIIVCHNAAPVVAKLYERIDKELYDEIYFFDDDSPDGSAEVAKQFDWIVIKLINLFVIYLVKGMPSLRKGFLF